MHCFKNVEVEISKPHLFLKHVIDRKSSIVIPYPSIFMCFLSLFVFVSLDYRKKGLPAGFDPSAVLGGMGFTAISQVGHLPVPLQVYT